MDAVTDVHAASSDPVARPQRRPRPAPITVTPAAADRIADLIARAPEAAAGVRLTTPKRGCSGLAYSLTYVTAANPGDEAVATAGGTLFIDGGSLMYLIGSEMDWAEDDFAAGFVFSNPNAKGQCGCGESFTV
ncbi:MAG: iron-sulfur cluster assembly accessory protein [Sphingomonadaceae bacterium]|nr:iron-sulfur cluster assembly accessory protein [Sphingomonadaceae bacterium]